MAKVTITVEDTEMGGIECGALFQPEWHQGLKSTPAQNVAGMLLQVLTDTSKRIKDDGAKMAEDSVPEGELLHEDEVQVGESGGEATV